MFNNKILINKKFLTVFFLCLSFFSYVSAANPLDVVVNEIAWMGTKESANNEWIELYNNGNSAIDIGNWTLKALDNSPKITLKGIIPANGFFLLERTDDNVIPNIPADQIYTGALENNGEELMLYDNLGNLIDSINCSSKWFAGDNATKQTMERKDSKLPSSPQNWQTSQNSGGTAKTKNSLIQATQPIEQPKSNIKPETSSATPSTSTLASTSTVSASTSSSALASTSTATAATTAATTATTTASSSVEKENQANSKPVSYPAGIVINEILPAPEGADDTEEWIEIKNLNEREVDLSGWKIKDVKGSVNVYVLPKGTKIGSKGFLVFSRPTTKITLNNNDDGISLIQPNGNICDSVVYQKAPKGQSYNRLLSETTGTEEQAKSDTWVWSSTLTPGATNVIPLSQSSQSLEKTTQEKNEATKTSNESSKLKSNKKFTASASNQVPDLPKSLLIFLLILVVAIVAGLAIFFFKKRLQKEDE